MYDIVWIASYTTPARKLTGTLLIQSSVLLSIFASESLVHDEFRVDGFQVAFTDCSCGHQHREWFSLHSIGGDTEAALEYVFARWMGLLGNLEWRKEYL